MRNSGTSVFRWSLGGAAAIVALCGWLLWGRLHPAGAAAPPPIPTVAVTAAIVRKTDVPVTISALGAAQAWRAVSIRPQVSGRLVRVVVREGAEVKTGDLIASIDPTLYRAQLTEAQGALNRDQAQLESARLDLDRYRQLVTRNLVARSTVDAQESLVKEREGTVLIAQGAVASARANLEWCQIVSPLSGRVGVRMIDEGNLVSANDPSGIVSVNQLEPIAVLFSVPQGDFHRLADASEGFKKPLKVEAFGQESGAKLDVGEVTISENHVDEASGTVQLKARFGNAKRLLWPGQFVNVRTVITRLSDVTVVPSASINRGPQGTFVYVIRDGQADMHPVKLALVQEPLAVVAEGVQPGDWVVTDGQVSLKPGSKVAVRAGGDREGSVSAPPAPATPLAGAGARRDVTTKRASSIS